VPEIVQVDAAILGDGLAAWIAARELVSRGRTAALLPAPVRNDTPSMRHHPVGPLPSYAEAIRRWGRESARQLWEVFREDNDELVRLCAYLGVADAVSHPGGFVLARTREEALELAEGEDLLREDGFSGEFLDHFLLETRFDVRGISAAYWAVDDLVAEEGTIVAALRAAGAGRVAEVKEPLGRVEMDGSGVVVIASSITVRADWLFLATNAAIPQLEPLPPIFQARAWSCVEMAVAPEVRVPSPGRSFDGAVRWERDDAQLWVTAEGPDAPVSLAWAGVPSAPPSRRRTGTALVSGDELPLLGRLAGTPLVVVNGGLGPGSACAVSGARWAVESVLTGRDPVPALLHAARFV
jgi:glycine/D-amino acid oxidase-like deaminating enzyme